MKIDSEIVSGFVRLHILHHAEKEPIYGLWIMEELSRHGYRLGAGTLYPILHGLERRGYLRSKLVRMGKTSRRMYRITPVGRRVLSDGKAKAKELISELFEE